MRIAVITDSYGGPRLHFGKVSVDRAQTYPELLKTRLLAAGHTVTIDFASFRQVKDLPGLMEKYPDAEIYIIQLGIVDFYPRPLSQKNTLSQNFFAKLLRRAIRMNRSFFIKYINSSPWSNELDVSTAIKNVCSKSDANFIWINAAPVNDFQEKQTPGAIASIRRFNKHLAACISEYKNCFLLDVFESIDKRGLDGLTHPDDSH